MLKKVSILFFIMTFYSLNAVSSEYVKKRYYCVDVNNGSDAGSCTVKGMGATCHDALSSHDEKVRKSGGDPCKYCANSLDKSKKTKRSKWIHGGPCK